MSEARAARGAEHQCYYCTRTIQQGPLVSGNFNFERKARKALSGASGACSTTTSLD